MKNILFILCAVMFLMFISDYVISEDLIPADAIRIRVIASSNDKKDQELKMMVKEDLEKYLYSKLKDVRSVDKADIVIKNSLDDIDHIVGKYTNNYDVNYGLNYFPSKEYKGITYKEGEYQSLVVTLNEGLGNNWWCVLFPPLCMLEAEESTDVEYRSFVSEMISKYIG